MINFDDVPEEHIQVQGYTLLFSNCRQIYLLDCTRAVQIQGTRSPQLQNFVWWHKYESCFVSALWGLEF